VQQHLWDGDWFARGITDAGTVFGCRHDQEGRIFLNPQSFALLAGIADADQQRRMLAAIEAELETPFGPMLCGPAYTRMREDIGRVTQKHPGSAENGSVYNHAAMFYAYSLYGIGEHDRAYRVLRRIIPGPDRDDLVRRGQLPVFVPNYYRGEPRRFPRTAGRSSQLLHTGSAAWMYRTVIEGLFGTRGCPEGLRIIPRLPSHWPEAKVRRRFRDAWFDIEYRRGSSASIVVDGRTLPQPLLTNIEAGRTYAVTVTVAAGSAE
jgi:cellobionic acid phosphorylase